jgi:hypothetical protein
MLQLCNLDNDLRKRKILELEIDFLRGGERVVRLQGAKNSEIRRRINAD